MSTHDGKSRQPHHMSVLQSAWLCVCVEHMAPSAPHAPKAGGGRQCGGFSFQPQVICPHQVRDEVGVAAAESVQSKGKHQTNTKKRMQGNMCEVPCTNVCMHPGMHGTTVPRNGTLTHHTP